MNDASRIPPDTRFSPAPGCIIMIIIGIVLGGSLAYSIYRGISMDREIDKFTVDEPSVVRSVVALLVPQAPPLLVPPLVDTAIPMPAGTSAMV